MIAAPLLAWYDQNRRVLPFRGTKDAYRVWVSEIMLQQTRTETVGAYYERFLARFPDVFALAAAKEDDVLKCWEGLGYYSRARNLHRAAKVIVQRFHGVFPADYEALRALPGVGDYTAAAVASIAFDLPTPAMDGNLTRVLSRFHGVREDVGVPSVKRRLRELASADMPSTRCGDFNQALMDLGATVCTPGTPNCENCPLSSECDAYAQDDAELLPVRSAGKPPKTVRLAVVVVTCQGKTLLYQRKETLLKGLWVFPLLENAETRAEVTKGLNALGVEIDYLLYGGPARHVFTHRIWEMTIWRCRAKAPVSKDGQWATLEQMAALALPTAMRAAKGHALEILTARYQFFRLNDGRDKTAKIAEADCEALLPLTAVAYSQSWQDAHRGQFSEAFWQEQTPAHMEMILRLHMLAGHDVICLMMGDEVAGVLVLGPKENEVISFYIHPRFQNQGLGKAALGESIRVNLNPHRDMRVTVLADNPRARHLYASLGFTRLAARSTLNPTRRVEALELIRPADP